MIQSTKGDFLVGVKNSFLTEHKQMRPGKSIFYNSERLTNKNNKTGHYICVDKGEAFQVSCSKKGNKGETTYGMVMYVDGIRVSGKNTFERIGWFRGFKQGKGVYREFRFSVPQQIGMIHDDEGEKEDLGVEALSFYQKTQK